MSQRRRPTSKVKSRDHITRSRPNVINQQPTANRLIFMIHMLHIHSLSFKQSCCYGSWSSNTTGTDILPPLPMPACPTCHLPVYHAEQTIGPNRQMYHKPCLVCLHCKNRVDPGGLQEHAGEAYCRNCHRMLFSPRGALGRGLA
jgi:hypothetical protein